MRRDEHNLFHKILVLSACFPSSWDTLSCDNKRRKKNAKLVHGLYFADENHACENQTPSPRSN